MTTQDVLRVEVQDATCSGDEHFFWNLPLDTDKAAIMKAIETLYPTTFSVSIFLDEIEAEDG